MNKHEAAAAIAADLERTLRQVIEAQSEAIPAANLAAAIAADLAADSPARMDPMDAAEYAADIVADLEEIAPNHKATRLARDLVALLNVMVMDPADVPTIRQAVEADTAATRAAITYADPPATETAAAAAAVDPVAAADLAAEDARKADPIVMGKVPRGTWAGQSEWDKENLETVSCQLPKEEAQLLRSLCRRKGITRYALLKYMCLVWIRAMEGWYNVR